MELAKICGVSQSTICRLVKEGKDHSEIIGICKVKKADKVVKRLTLLELYRERETEPYTRRELQELLDYLFTDEQLDTISSAGNEVRY